MLSVFRSGRNWAQNGSVACRGSRSCKWQTRDLNTGSPPPPGLLRQTRDPSVECGHGFSKTLGSSFPIGVINTRDFGPRVSRLASAHHYHHLPPQHGGGQERAPWRRSAGFGFQLLPLPPVGPVIGDLASLRLLGRMGPEQCPLLSAR